MKVDKLEPLAAELAAVRQRAWLHRLCQHEPIEDVNINSFLILHRQADLGEFRLGFRCVSLY